MLLSLTCHYKVDRDDKELGEKFIVTDIRLCWDPMMPVVLGSTARQPQVNIRLRRTVGIGRKLLADDRVY